MDLNIRKMTIHPPSPVHTQMEEAYSIKFLHYGLIILQSSVDIISGTLKTI